MQAAIQLPEKHEYCITQGLCRPDLYDAVKKAQGTKSGFQSQNTAIPLCEPIIRQIHEWKDG